MDWHVRGEPVLPASGLEGVEMCQAATAHCTFDPDLCPLLKGLSPDEQRQRMRSNPHIATCLAALSNASVQRERCEDRVRRTPRAVALVET